MNKFCSILAVIILGVVNVSGCCCKNKNNSNKTKTQGGGAGIKGPEKGEEGGEGEEEDNKDKESNIEGEEELDIKGGEEGGEEDVDNKTKEEEEKKKKEEEEERKRKEEEDKKDEEGKVENEVNVTIKGKKNVKIERIQKESYGNLVNYNFKGVTYIWKTDITDVLSKEYVESLKIKVESANYENKPYMLAVITIKSGKSKENYIIFCEKANTIFNGTDFGLFRGTNINAITICSSKNLTNVSALFYSCQHLETINIIDFDVKNVTDASFMFAFCKKIEEIADLPSLIFENVTTTQRMFLNCDHLTKVSLKLHSVNLSDMYGMFECCDSLEEINLNCLKCKKDKLEITNFIKRSYKVEKVHVLEVDKDIIDKFSEELGKDYEYSNGSFKKKQKKGKK